MTRPPIEDLDRLHGEASDGEWLKPFDDGAVAKPGGSESLLMLDIEGMAVFESPHDAEFTVSAHNAWPQVSEYIRGLESALKVCRRALKNDPYRWYLQEIASADAALGDADE